MFKVLRACESGIEYWNNFDYICVINAIYIYIYIECYIINLNLIDNEQIEIKMNLVYVSFHIYILFFNISH